MGLFEPKWKSSNEEKAIEAIQFLNAKQDKAEKIFREIILTETRENVIKTAINKIQDEAFLKEIYLDGKNLLKIQGEPAERVIYTAGTHIHDQEFIRNMILEEKGKYYALANNLDKTNKDLAYDILSGKLKRKVDKDFYHNAVNCIGDEKLIYELAKSTESNWVAEACVYGLRNNTEILKELAGTGTIIAYHFLSDKFLKPETVLKAEARKYLKLKGV